jgi:hypothetical protein
MIQITLTKSEAALCRDASASYAKRPPTFVTGENKLERAVWYDVQRWLTWVCTDLEAKRTVDVRRASENLSMRIEGVIERYDLVAGPVPTVETKPDGCLF